MAHTVRVDLKGMPDRSYSILVKKGLLKQLPGLIARQWKGREVFVISDANVQRLYGRTLLRGLADKGLSAVLLDFPAGEASKNAGMVFALHTQLLVLGVRRDSLIVALGGGVVGDVAGYVAATVLRGVRYIQIPTTLLAQVDSSVGGKVGVDHPVGKNLIGAFHQPAAVFIDPDVLHTLPGEEFRNGLAEIVKIAAALDKRFFAKLERSARALSKSKSELLAGIISHAVGLKSGIVGQDEFESGLRKVLNLGHTIGHAIEASEDFAVKHGAAVAMGMAAEARIAASMGLLEQKDCARLHNLLEALGLPTKIPPISSRSKFFAALSADKKSSGGITRFVMLRKIGTSLIGVDVPTPYIMHEMR